LRCRIRDVGIGGVWGLFQLPSLGCIHVGSRGGKCQGLGFRISEFGIMAANCGLIVQGADFRVQGFGFRGSGLGICIWDSGMSGPGSNS
jgi:hypothetical protein